MKHKDDIKTSQKVTKGPKECFPQERPFKGLWGLHESLIDPIAKSKLENPMCASSFSKGMDRAESPGLEEQGLVLT